LLQFDPHLSEEEATEKSKTLYLSTKGKKIGYYSKWSEGSESEMFNKLEEIAKSSMPTTPALEAKITTFVFRFHVSSFIF
jgi:hypothetical protein